ncbi:hypothetical protein FLA_2172 [Filimonas lacunae]|nr:hypothetical protein FLA_2172 [Filimonas lacunae]
MLKERFYFFQCFHLIATFIWFIYCFGKQYHKQQSRLECVQAALLLFCILFFTF